MSIVLKIFTIHKILHDVLKCRRARGHWIHTNSDNSLTNYMISSIVIFNEAMSRQQKGWCVYISIYLYIYLYNYIIESVCLFVRGKRQNYGTDWPQMLKNYEERPGKCPLRVEIIRLSVHGEISWHFRLFVRGRPPFLLILFHYRLLCRRLTQSAFIKRHRPCATSLLFHR